MAGRKFPQSAACLSYLSHVDVLGDDLCSGRRRQFAEHHELHPLRHAVEQRDGAVQGGVVHQAAVDHVAVIVRELDAAETERHYGDKRPSPEWIKKKK